MIQANAGYFIKLGRNGGWEDHCISSGELRLGFFNPYHADVLNGHFEGVKEYYKSQGKKPGVVTSIVNQINTFYHSSESTLWITFYKRRLWWCFAQPQVTQMPDGSRIRKTVDGWHSTDVAGIELSVEKLSGKLTKVQMFQGTICIIKELSYLANKINAIKTIEISTAEQALDNLKLSLIPLIKGLTWKDFELLVDLIFSNAGWKRIGVVGKTEKDIDLDLVSPLNSQRVYVQVKAESTQNEFDSSVNTFLENDLYDEMYFVVHSSKNPILEASYPRPVTLIMSQKLASLIIDAGLVKWIISKAT